jgi:hypothetical protein
MDSKRLSKIAAVFRGLMLSVLTDRHIGSFRQYMLYDALAHTPGIA